MWWTTWVAADRLWRRIHGGEAPRESVDSGSGPVCQRPSRFGVEEVQLGGVDPHLRRLPGPDAALGAQPRHDDRLAGIRPLRNASRVVPELAQVRRLELGRLDAEVRIELRSHRLDEVEPGAERRASTPRVAVDLRGVLEVLGTDARDQVALLAV